jgi:hypothetical protein
MEVESTPGHKDEAASLPPPERNDAMEVKCRTSFSCPDGTIKSKGKIGFKNLSPRQVARGWTPACFSTNTRGVKISNAHVIEKAITNKYRAVRAYLQVAGQWIPGATPNLPAIIDGRLDKDVTDEQLHDAASSIWEAIKESTNPRMDTDIRKIRIRNTRWYRLARIMEEGERRGLDILPKASRSCYTSFLAMRRFARIARACPGDEWSSLTLSRTELGCGSSAAWEFVFSRIQLLLRAAASPDDCEVAEAVRISRKNEIIVIDDE